MSGERLAGCPWCGGAARIVDNRERAYNGWDWYIECDHDPSCPFGDAEGHAGDLCACSDDRAELVKMWNRRMEDE